jgi:hypothetical protein
LGHFHTDGYESAAEAATFSAMNKPLPIQECVRCRKAMVDIKGSRMAVYDRCGYKDDCC